MNAQSSSLTLAYKRRDELLAYESWLSAAEIPRTSESERNALRESGQLLGVWTGKEYLYPSFQFRPETSVLIQEMTELLRILPKDPTGWRQTFWIFQRHAGLGGRRPADAFRAEPDAVIGAARSDFQVSDENW